MAWKLWFSKYPKISQLVVVVERWEDLYLLAQNSCFVHGTGQLCPLHNVLMPDQAKTRNRYLRDTNARMALNGVRYTLSCTNYHSRCPHLVRRMAHYDPPHWVPTKQEVLARIIFSGNIWHLQELDIHFYHKICHFQAFHYAQKENMTRHPWRLSHWTMVSLHFESISCSMFSVLFLCLQTSLVLFAFCSSCSLPS